MKNQNIAIVHIIFLLLSGFEKNYVEMGTISYAIDYEISKYILARVNMILWTSFQFIFLLLCHKWENLGNHCLMYN